MCDYIEIVFENLSDYPDVTRLIVKYSIGKYYTPSKIKDGEEPDYQDFSNPDNYIVDYAIKHIQSQNDDTGDFSMNPNDRAIDWLINNTLKIDYEYFQQNTNDKAVEFFIKEQDKVNEFNKKLKTSGNQGLKKRNVIHSEFSENSNNKAVEWLIKHPEFINMYYLQDNKNDKAMEFLVKQVDFYGDWAEIDYAKFLKTPNDKIVEWIIKKEEENPSKELIFTKNFSRNTNDKAVKWLIEHEDKIDFQEFSLNSNDEAVDWLINKRSNKIDLLYFQSNKNVKAREWLSKNKLYNIALDIGFSSKKANPFEIDGEKLKLLNNKVYSVIKNMIF